MAVARTDRSVIARWWRTVDHWMLLAILLLAAVGAILVMAASPAVADRIGFDSFHFVRRQLLFLGPAVALMIGLSLLSPLWVRRVASVGFIAALALLAATIAIGHDIKGASSWMPMGGFVLQPAVFIKPAFAVVAAWMLAVEGGVDLLLVVNIVFGLVIAADDADQVRAIVVHAVGAHHDLKRIVRRDAPAIQITDNFFQRFVPSDKYFYASSWPVTVCQRMRKISLAAS